MNEEYKSIAIVGLGYVGLPLALEFDKHFEVYGIDASETRIDELTNGIDTTLETNKVNLENCGISFSCDFGLVNKCDVVIVALPTPVDVYKTPDLSILVSASQKIGENLKQGSIVVYESTVFPGATEDICVPVLEASSGMKLNDGFFVGYSPERINPGDKKHTLKDIVKVVSGSSREVSETLAEIYGKIIEAGIHKAENIKIAEASKVIENAQRDINIALINELAMFADKLGVDTSAILKAAGTKWNFLPFSPGLVGGHCIGVDPYYLSYKAKEVDMHADVILAGRRINDGMADFAATKFVKKLAARNRRPHDSKILVLGFSFKENCPDTRNTKVADMVNSINEFGFEVDVHDPWITADKEEQNFNFVEEPEQGKYGGIILAVNHHCFVEWGASKIRSLGDENHLFFDMRSAFDASESDLRL